MSIRFDKPGVTREIGAIIHFADFVKDICSRVFLINREYFDKILYKEQLCYLMDNGKFVKLNEVPSDYIIANHAILSTTSIASLLKGYNNKVAISLRTMLQYVGTELGRNQLGDNCWINATMSNAGIIRNRFGFCAIADVRFANECDSIRNQKEDLLLKLKDMMRTKLSLMSLLMLVNLLKVLIQILLLIMMAINLSYFTKCCQY